MKALVNKSQKGKYKTPKLQGVKRKTKKPTNEKKNCQSAIIRSVVVSKKLEQKY